MVNTPATAQRFYTAEEVAEIVRRWTHGEGRNYFCFFRGLLKFMSPEAAIVLQSLINLAQKYNKDGWLLCTVEHIRESLFFERDAQIRILTELKDKGLIDWTRRGVPPRRYVRIHLLQIDELLKNYNQTQIKKCNRSQHIPLVEQQGIPLVEQQGIPLVEQQGIPLIHIDKEKNTKNKQQRRGDRGRISSPFELNPTPSTNGHKPKSPSQEDRAALEQLRKAMRDNGRVFRPTGGAEVFRKLREADKQDYHTVLDWYCAHCSREDQQQFNLTDIASPADFYRKYTWIEGKMLKGGRKATPGRPRRETVEITPEAEAIVAELTNSPWPNGSAEELPPAVQKSLTAHQKIIKVLKELVKRPERPGRSDNLTGLLRYLLAENYGYPTVYVRQWFEKVYKQVRNWDAWSGRLDPYVISLDNERYIRDVKQMAATYGAAVKDIVRLLATLRERL